MDFALRLSSVLMRQHGESRLRASPSVTSAVRATCERVNTRFFGHASLACRSTSREAPIAIRVALDGSATLASGNARGEVVVLVALQGVAQALRDFARCCGGACGVRVV